MINILSRKRTNMDTVNPVYNPLRELVGIYVEEV